MWLPAAGWLQTVVLLTTGKCAVRWTFLGVLIYALLLVAVTEEADEVAEDVDVVVVTVGRPLGRADLGDDGGGALTIARRHEPDVGRTGDQGVRDARVAEGGDHRLPLRRPRGDRGAL